MIENNLFFHIDSINVPSYFSCACLKPAKYFINRIDDVQNRCEASLLLSSKKYAEDADCSLEVVLTTQEKENLISFNDNPDIFLFNSAIPISRICKIYFKSFNTKDKTISLTNLSSGFIPDSLASVVVDNDFADYSKIAIHDDLVVPDLSQKIKIFDSLLGGFALMRLACNEQMNYSENYFSTLSRFNSLIEDELLKSEKRNKTKINEIFWDAFEGNSSFIDLFPYINKDLTIEDLDMIARQEGQIIKKDPISGNINIHSLERGTYIVAILFSYGMSNEGRKNKIDGLILNKFQKDIRSDKSEVIALCYGLNRGYSRFSNKYKTSSLERVVKFELNSQVDYYTIEALYQYSFNQIQKTREFPYLDSWCTRYPKLTRRLKNGEYIILDKVICGEVIKVGSAKWWLDFMQIFFSKSGWELIKPFMQKVFEKIKTDIDLEYQDMILEKDDTITKLKEEIQEINSKISSIAETPIEYLPNAEKDSHTVELQNRVDALENLIKEINKKTKSGKVKEVIKEFYKTNSNDLPMNFKE